MSSDEKGISPAHKTSTPTHRSASSSTSSQRDSRQVREEYNVPLVILEQLWYHQDMMGLLIKSETFVVKIFISQENSLCSVDLPDDVMKTLLLLFYNWESFFRVQATEEWLGEALSVLLMSVPGGRRWLLERECSAISSSLVEVERPGIFLQVSHWSAMH